MEQLSNSNWPKNRQYKDMGWLLWLEWQPCLRVLFIYFQNKKNRNINKKYQKRTASCDRVTVLFVCTIHVFWVHQTGPSVSNLVMDTTVNEGSLNILNSFNFVSRNTSRNDNHCLNKYGIHHKLQKDYQDFVKTCGVRTRED